MWTKPLLSPNAQETNNLDPPGEADDQFLFWPYYLSFVPHPSSIFWLSPPIVLSLSLLVIAFFILPAGEGHAKVNCAGAEEVYSEADRDEEKCAVG